MLASPTEAWEPTTIGVWIRCLLEVPTVRSRFCLSLFLTLLLWVPAKVWAAPQDGPKGQVGTGEVRDTGPTEVSKAVTPIDSRGISGALIIGGGGKLTESAFKRFMSLAGGENASLVVIPTASQRADEEEADYSEPWQPYHPTKVVVLHTRDREVANQDEFVAPLRTATGVWISGGSQSRLAEVYVGTALEDELRALLDRGGVIGGSSAGAAIMSRTMIASGKTQPRMETGLGLLPNAIIDQHFLARNRQQRSLAAVEDHPDHFGLGIDEGTVLEVRGRTMRVIGDSTVTITLASSSTRDPLVYQIRPGQNADLTALRRAAIARSGSTFPDAEVHTPHVDRGSLVIVGGGRVTDDIADRFVELAGGASAKIVVLPTAGDDRSARRAGVPSFLREREVESVTVLPQRWRDEVESPEFQDAFNNATGIWFGGGRQWRFIDAYEGTVAEAMFRGVLERGGVIGGSSAGASIQAEYMVRGNPLGNTDMMAEGYERGLNFLPGVAIDQHLSQRNRLPDLRSVIERFPQLLGVGLDESTAIVVQRSKAEVIGENAVFFLDGARESETRLVRGESYDLAKRRKLDKAPD